MPPICTTVPHMAHIRSYMYMRPALPTSTCACTRTVCVSPVTSIPSLAQQHASSLIHVHIHVHGKRKLAFKRVYMYTCMCIVHQTYLILAYFSWSELLSVIITKCTKVKDRQKWLHLCRWHIYINVADLALPSFSNWSLSSNTRTSARQIIHHTN